ncbi:rhodanese-like domain-containing protein, partial [Escherichia coli]
EHHVVAYDDEGGAWAGRLLWNLHCLGFEQTSLLNGGIHGWLAAGLPTSSEQAVIKAADALVQVDLGQIEKYRVKYDLLRQMIK